jgi:hypothetical protein
MTDWTPEEDEAFNEVEKNSNLGKQILQNIEGQPYVYTPKRAWVGLTDEEIVQMGLSNYMKVVRETEAKLKEKNT